MLAFGSREAPRPPPLGLEPLHQAERRIADRAGHRDEIAGTRIEARRHEAFADGTDERDRDAQRAWRSGRVAPDERAGIEPAILGESLEEGLDPIRVELLWQSERHQETERLCALGGEVREVHAQRLARDEIGRI